MVNLLRRNVVRLTGVCNDGDLSARITELHQSKADIDWMRSDTETEYRYISANRQTGDNKGKPATPIPLGARSGIQTMFVGNSLGSVLHEGRHGGDIARGNLTGSTYGVQDEISAYKAQYSFDGKLNYLSNQIPSKEVLMQRIIAGQKNPLIETITNIIQITPSVVNSMVDPGFKQLYPPKYVSIQQWHSN